MDGAGDGTVLHATTVAFGGRGVLIVGPSGAGKSALGLQLIALGARLVADDRTLVRRRDGVLIAAAPPGLPPWIEARGVGLLGADRIAEATLALAVDLGRVETDRLPQRRTFGMLQCRIDLALGPVTAHLPAAIRQYVVAGRHA
jgi:HPr kinase/phosphorylase